MFNHEGAAGACARLQRAGGGDLRAVCGVRRCGSGRERPASVGADGARRAVLASCSGYRGDGEDRVGGCRVLARGRGRFGHRGDGRGVVCGDPQSAQASAGSATRSDAARFDADAAYGAQDGDPGGPVGVPGPQLQCGAGVWSTQGMPGRSSFFAARFGTCAQRVVVFVRLL